MISKRLYALQIKIGLDFEKNLEKILCFVQQCGKDAIIVTPEVALSGFCYQKMSEASEFSKIATEKFLEATKKNTLITTMIEKTSKGFYNNLKVFSHGEVLHKQSKSKLFSLGDEQLHFKSGSVEEIVPFYIGDIKCGALNCFELRFSELWQRLKGVEIIFVPAQWGKARKDHFETLCKALAISNQCFVVASGAANEMMAKSSSIITPYGLMYKNDKREIVSSEVNLDEAQKMRKYINTGIPLSR